MINMKIRCFSCFLLFLLHMLAACGGENEEVVSSAKEPQDWAPSVEVVDPRPAQDEQAESTEVQPELIDADEPDIIATDDPGWGESGTPAQSACNHPYFPLRTGYTYTMSHQSGEILTWEVLNVEGDMQVATAEMQISGDEFAHIYTWECSADEGLVSYEFGNQTMSIIYPKHKIEIIDGSGIFLPPPEGIIKGGIWASSSNSRVSYNQNEGGQEIGVTAEIENIQFSTILNTDPVHFNGQTIDGMLVRQDGDMGLTITKPQETTETGMSIGSEIQFGRGVGILRKTTFTEVGDVTSELQAYYVP